MLLNFTFLLLLLLRVALLFLLYVLAFGKKKKAEMLF